MKKAIVVILALCLLFSSVALAHSGRTDGKGGHNKTADGTYHYHSGSDRSVEYATREEANGTAKPAATQAPTQKVIVEAPATKSVSLKSKSTIKAVQEKLNDEGYECGKPDGRIGKKTKAAIKAFQKDNDLEATGKLNAETYEALFS